MPTCIAVLLLALSPAVAFAAPAQDTPALQVFKQWLGAFNSGDEARVTAFWKRYGTNETQPRIEGDLHLHQMTGAMTILRITEDTGTHVVALMQEANGGYSESTLDLASADPPVVRGMSGHRVPPPGDAQPPAASDEDLAQRVRAHATAIQGLDAFSGAVLIARNGKIVLNQAWGMADIGRRIGNTTETRFCIGSMNKMFTAVAILQLVAQGKLALDTPIAAYWPAYPNRDLASRVTIRELLNHTGGTGDIFTPEFAAHRTQLLTLADYVKLYGNRPVAFPPGTRMDYSNYGFILLGRIIEIVSGESYDEYVHQHIYLPAGMTHTDAGPEAGHLDGYAVGYKRGPHGPIPNTDDQSRGTSAGGGYSTVHDLFQFATSLQDGKLLDPALLKQATTASPMRTDYGMGFYVLGHGAYGHGGGGPGINGELHILPGSGYVIVALVNRDPPMASDMVNWIASILPRR